jgi:fumarylacetoacetate (FAA) hydrolase
MRLATVRAAGELRVAVLWRRPEGGLWIDVAEAALELLGEDGCPSSLRLLLAREGTGLATPHRILSELERGTLSDTVATWPQRGVHLAPPVPDPGVLIDFYAFEEHVRQARARRGLEIVPEWYRYPVYYRSNQRALLGDGAEVWFPAGEGRMDYELELAAVLGSRLESPTPAEAEAAIAGYCLFNDWSARAIQAEVMKVGLGPAKGKDFASSLGPWMVTPDEVGDLGSLPLSARINGKVWSQGTPGAMRWTWGELLAFAGEGVRLEPGDVFGSGTIGGGCGLEQDRYLQPGDVVALDGGDALGVLTGTVRRRERDV